MTSDRTEVNACVIVEADPPTTSVPLTEPAGELDVPFNPTVMLLRLVLRLSGCDKGVPTTPEPASDPEICVDSVIALVLSVRVCITLAVTDAVDDVFHHLRLVLGCGGWPVPVHGMPAAMAHEHYSAVSHQY